MGIKELLEIPHKANHDLSEKIRLNYLSNLKDGQPLSPKTCYLLYLDVRHLEEKYASQILQFKIQLRDSEYCKESKRLLAKYKQKYGELEKGN